MRVMIERLQNKYNIEYDVKDNILIIRDKIEVIDFVNLKRMLNKCRIKTELRVIGENNDRKRFI